MGKLYKAYCRVYQNIFKIAMNFLPWNEPKVFSGEDSVFKIADVLKNENIKNVLLVTDNGLKNIGLADELIKVLEDNSIKCTVFTDVQQNPSIDNVENAKKVYLENGCCAIIAFGGGSPIDCAKGAGARISNPGKTISQMRGQIKVRKPLPLFIAVPTTAGTGSETTVATVITDTKTHEKYAVNDPKLRPDYAILDPKLTVGLPAHITSTTGIDALTHAIEAYIGKSNTKDTKRSAEKAVRLIFENLERAYNEPKNIQSRKNMLEASYHAGLAFTRAYVGYVHAIAHQLGGLYSTPHGLANAVILPYVLEWFGENVYEKLSELSKCAGISDPDKSDKENALLFIQAIKNLNEKFSIPDKFDFIREEDIPIIVKRALKEANPLYPVPKIMDEKDCEEVVRKIMK